MAISRIPYIDVRYIFGLVHRCTVHRFSPNEAAPALVGSLVASCSINEDLPTCAGICQLFVSLRLIFFRQFPPSPAPVPFGCNSPSRHFWRRRCTIFCHSGGRNTHLCDVACGSQHTTSLPLGILRAVATDRLRAHAPRNSIPSPSLSSTATLLPVQ